MSVYFVVLVAAAVIGLGLFVTTAKVRAPIDGALSIVGIAGLILLVVGALWVRVSKPRLSAGYDDWARAHPRRWGAIYGLIALPFYGGLALGSRSLTPKIVLVISALAFAVIVFSPELDQLIFHRRE